MLTGYMLFAQIMVIWYGNLPEETGFLLERYNSPAWRWVMWSVVIGAFLLPFAAMVIREVKTNPKVLACVAFLVLVAMMVERYLLVGPSLMPGPPHLGPVEIFTTLGFAGAFAIALDWAFRWPSHREGE